jgi:hypothetical protein
MTTLADIELKAKRYGDARASVSEIVSALDDAIKALKKAELPKLRRAVARAAEAHDELKALIEAAPELFIKPKTATLHGIRLGYVKGKGKIEWDDPEKVVRLIKKHFPDQADVLIATKESPVKDALNGLSAADLKKLGISVIEGGEAVFIKPVDSEVDKMVDALLKDAINEMAEA